MWILCDYLSILFLTNAPSRILCFCPWEKLILEVIISGIISKIKTGQPGGKVHINVYIIFNKYIKVYIYNTHSKLLPEAY